MGKSQVQIVKLKKSIAIAGSHGKTTTTSLIGSIFDNANYDPTIVNGGIINSYSKNNRYGRSNWMIVEADESDGSFLKLPHEINIITNIDIEHLDYYKSKHNLLLQAKLNLCPLTAHSMTSDHHNRPESHSAKILTARLFEG